MIIRLIELEEQPVMSRHRRGDNIVMYLATKIYVWIYRSSSVTQFSVTIISLRSLLQRLVSINPIHLENNHN